MHSYFKPEPKQGGGEWVKKMEKKKTENDWETKHTNIIDFLLMNKKKRNNRTEIMATGGRGKQNCTWVVLIITRAKRLSLKLLISVSLADTTK